MSSDTLMKLRKVLQFTLLLCVSTLLSNLSLCQNISAYTYDDLNRVTKVVVNKQIEILYTYDAAGNRTSEQVINLNPVPTLSSLTPEGVIAGAPTLTLTFKGNNFVNGATVQWSGANRATAFINGSQLTATIPAADIASVGSASVTVVNPEPGGGVSNALSFKVQAQPNPVPTLASLSPDSIVAGAAGLTLAVNGANFVDGSKVLWNGSERATTFGSASKLTAAIAAADVAAVANATVTVYSPAPGGGTSGALTFAVKPPRNGYEADVSPRAGVNGAVDSSDWLQVGRFVVGLDAATAGSEFQRADAAPRASLGDGRLTLADWVQAGRYAVKLNPLVEAGRIHRQPQLRQESRGRRNRTRRSRNRRAPCAQSTQLFNAGSKGPCESNSTRRGMKTPSP